MKNVYPRNLYQIRQTVFDKLDSFGIEYTIEQKLSKNFAIFDFESSCAPEKTLRDTNTIFWIGKQVPISASISSKLAEEPIFLCNSDVLHLVASFIGSLENLASQSKAKKKNFFPDIETIMKIRLGSILEKFTQRQNRREQVRRFDMIQDDFENKNCASIQFLQIQKNQLFELQTQVERYWIVLIVFGCNSVKSYPNLIKSFLLPILVNERNIEPTVIQKVSQFIFFKLDVVQLLDIRNFLGGAKILDSFLKSYKT